MANFNSFKITDSGLDLLYKCQAGKTLKFTKFMLGDGSYSGSIRDLSNLVNPVKSEDIKRLSIAGVGDAKKLIIGFDLTNEDVTQGFYLREIGIYANDPDTNDEVLVYYTNSGETADYIPAISTDTIMQKLMNAEIYISDVAEITATIDTSLVYATQSDIERVQNSVPAKISDLQNDTGYLTETDIDKKGYLTNETDPTVPEYIKNITKEDIDKWNNGGNANILIFTNVIVETTSWVEDATYSEFGFKADISCIGVTEDYYPNVTFDVPQALSENYAPVSLSGQDTVTIYCVNVPQNTVTIPSIICSKEG